MDKISVIIPCHNNAKAIQTIYADILRELKKLPVSYEILFIDNASRDNTSTALHLLSQQDYACHYVVLKHRVTSVSAIFLGSQLSNGNLLMLTDSRHPAYLIPKLYQSLYGKVQCCGGKLITDGKRMRKQPLFKLLRKDYVCDSLQRKDISAFRKILLQENSCTVWIPYTDLERSLITWRDYMYSFLMTYEAHILSYAGMSVFLLIGTSPCFLIFIIFFDILYAVSLYIGLFLALLFLFIHFHYHPYFFRHKQLLLSDIKESTLHNSHSK